jgi:hypothetical protein
MPSPPWSLGDYTIRGEIRGYSSARFRTSFHLPSGIFNMADLDASRAVYWVRDAAMAPPTGIPLLTILHWWTTGLEMQLLHAGVVGTHDGAALLAGHGGAGKSNTALSCAAFGLQYVSDDFALLELAPRPRAHSLFCTARVHEADLEYFPSLKPLVTSPAGANSDKALLFLEGPFAAQLARQLPLQVILLPRVSGQRRTTWEPARAAVAHRALTAVTLHILPGAGQQTLDTIGRMVKSLPAYVLHVGVDRGSIPAAVHAILEETR